DAIASAITELRSSGAPTETLAEYRPPRRMWLIPRRASFVTIGPVWRLGVLLLAADGALFATGAVTRARDPKHPNFTSVSGEERRELREAAARAGFGVHDTVNFDAAPLRFDETLGTVGPLVRRREELTVSWNGSRTADSLRPFGGYLRERVELAVRPPEGAGETAR
ncbi:MAG: hypothetical protein M3N46_00985, partial [Actinomycetota bacterium]|nr:hypothetical protein [Actinomycetota bacterium]